MKCRRNSKGKTFRNKVFEDTTNPLSYYSTSKCTGRRIIRNNSLLSRGAWIVPLNSRYINRVKIDEDCNYLYFVPAGSKKFSGATRKNFTNRKYRKVLFKFKICSFRQLFESKYTLNLARIDNMRDDYILVRDCSHTISIFNQRLRKIVRRDFQGRMAREYWFNHTCDNSKYKNCVKKFFLVNGRLKCIFVRKASLTRVTNPNPNE